MLIVGDRYTSKNNINAIKNKYSDFYSIIEVSATEKSVDQINALSGIGNFLSQPKIIIINDLPNQKLVRESLIELLSTESDRVKFVVWDSTNAIRLDPKTKMPNKTWGEFINKFRQIPNCKFVNNGAEFNDKDDDAVLDFVSANFLKNKKTIEQDVAKIFVSIVGIDRGLLLSEIEKLSIKAPDKIDADFIIENTFPTSKEAILYKFGNCLDSSFTKSIIMLEQFLDAGINANVLAEVIAKKARWQLAACYFYSKGMAWYDVDKAIMNMGKFPSVVWNSSKMDYAKKQAYSESCETEEGLKEFIRKAWGLPLDYFDISPNKPAKKSKKKVSDEEEGEEKTSSKKSILGKKEVLPMPFLATQMTSALQNSFVKPNLEKFNSIEIKEKLLNKVTDSYLTIVEKLKQIRYNDNPDQALYDMVRIITDRSLL